MLHLPMPPRRVQVVPSYSDGFMLPPLGAALFLSGTHKSRENQGTVKPATSVWHRGAQVA